MSKGEMKAKSEKRERWNTRTCVVCNSQETKFLYIGRDRMYGIAGEFKVFQCNNCGLIFLDKFPSIDCLKNYYPENNYYAYNPSKSLKYTRRLGNIKDLIKNSILNRIYGYEFPYGTRIIKSLILVKLLSLLFGHYVKGREAFLPCYLSGGKILEIGFGNGEYLDKMRKLGWKVIGIELSKKAVSNAAKRGLEVYYGTVSNVHLPERSFDVIYMWHVLEHLPNPREIIREIHRLLRPDGFLFIAVPNTRNIQFKLFGKYWDQLDVPRHLFNYSPSNLRLLLNKENFHPVWIKTRSWGKNSFFKSFRYLKDEFKSNSSLPKAVLWTFIGKVVDNKIMEMLVKILQYFFNISGFGENIEVLSKKINRNEKNK